MTVRERPGIYAEYQVKNLLQSSGNGLTVGVAAHVLGGSTETERVLSYVEALEKYGLSPMARLIKILFYNGAGKIIAAPVTNSYNAAFGSLVNAGADILISDSNDIEGCALMSAALRDTDYCIGINEFDGTAEQCIELAEIINFERFVLCGSTTEEPGNIAAALAGYLAYKNDPMAAFNGAVLYGCGEPQNGFTEQEIEELIAGGVTPFEYEGGNACVIRAVTTKTSTDDVPDKSLRELNTVLVANDVLKSVRDALKIRFAGARNDGLTRGAIRSQVAVELEKKLKKGIIEGYGNISAAADAEDATLCRVSFDFTAAHGLNTIALTAYLEV